MLTRRIVSTALLATFVAFSLQGSAQAQGYPNRPVRLVLPFAAGGVADVTARIVADKLGEKLGQRFVVENQPGPGGIAAARAVLSSPADGHTLAMLTNGTAVSVPLFKSLAFDPLKDFTPVSTLGLFDLVVVTNAETKFATLADFLKAAREQPGKLNIGTINVGSTQNLSAELLKATTGIDVAIIPFRATPDAVVALLRNDVQIVIDIYAGLRAGALRQQAEGAGSDRHGAHGGDPERADRDRGRRAWIRRYFLERALCTGWNAAGDRCTAESGTARDSLGAGPEEALQRVRHRGQAEHAGRARPAHARRHRQMGHGDRARQYSEAIRCVEPVTGLEPATHRG